MSHLTLCELRSFPIPTGSLTVWWLGQSGYFLKSPRGKLVVIDPYLSNACKEENGDRYGTSADRRIPAPMRSDDLVGVDQPQKITFQVIPVKWSMIMKNPPGAK